MVSTLLIGVDGSSVVVDLQAWLKQQAATLAPALPSAAKESATSTSSEGLCYIFIHALLGRRLRDLAFSCADLLLTAASAEHHELRALAGLALGCLGQSPQRTYEAIPLAEALVALCAVPEGYSAAQRVRRL